MKSITILFTSVIFSVFCLSAEGAPAFPGAEGAGKNATGGRGGTVYEVTNLNDSGPGSLREGLNTMSKRIIVFRVSGTIELASALSIPSDKTIAGQTAPGDGITLKGNHVEFGGGSNIIVRYIRIRSSEAAGGNADAFTPTGSNAILDHVSVSWGIDEVLSWPQNYTGQNVTIQWCIISEGLNHSTHLKGEHGKGTLLYNSNGNKISLHHNLYAHNVDRNPRISANNSASIDPLGPYVDFRNNVVYNWGLRYAGHNPGANSAASYNFVGNYYIHGPNSPETSVPWEEEAKYAKGYFHDNWVDGNNPADPWSVVRFVGMTDANIAAYKQTSQLPITPIPPTDGALTAYQKVLADAGCTVPYRDSVDSRMVRDIAEGKGGVINCTEANDFYTSQATAQGGTSNTITFASGDQHTSEFSGDHYEIAILSGTGAGQTNTIESYDPGTKVATVRDNWTTIPDATSYYAIIIRCFDNARGWPVLESGTPPEDGDHDGMPDAWETAKGLDPCDVSDGKLDQDADGYTNVEEYLNYLVDRKAALPADFDQDGDVDESDLEIFVADAEWLVDDCYDVPRGNMDFDCDADFKDYAKFADNWLEVYGY